ncbi:MAG: hypothetical protein ACLQVX_03620 [Limisphaerales bacterium]
MSPASGKARSIGASDPATVYYVPGTTGWEATFGGLPTASWTPPNPAILINNPAWSPLATNTVTGGLSYFSDRQWTNHPARFYRVRSP